jgi:hypothetical protein
MLNFIIVPILLITILEKGYGINLYYTYSKIILKEKGNGNKLLKIYIRNYQ